MDLVNSEKGWINIAGVGKDGSSPRIPFPIQFSDNEIKQQEGNGELWAHGVELMESFVDETGRFKHWMAGLVIWIIKYLKGS